MKKIRLFCIAIISSLFALKATAQGVRDNLADKVVCIDAGHGGTAQTDSYRVGPSGEREEWINLRVALYLQKLLEERGVKVIMTRTDDSNIPLTERARIAREANADLFLSIHHNATADSKVNFPIIYFNGNASENQAGVAFGLEVAKALKGKLYQDDTPVSLVSDYTIFPSAGASVLRETYGIPGVLAEASFFTNPEEEERLKNTEYNKIEAESYLSAIEQFFNNKKQQILEKNSIATVIPFPVLQEAERMDPVAQLWNSDYIEGHKLMKRNDKESLQKAYDLFTRSARSFPDSFVAKSCHENRVLILRQLGMTEEAEQEALRVKEFFVL